ncbi:MAG: GNAT family N-acetyltransferase [Actinomycetia bacterium]|nr:GNAT family N-acetyltransferase [Actinomycetes bacterium]
MLVSIEDLHNNKIIKIIERNLFEQIRYYRKSPKVQLVDSERIIKFFTDIPLPFFNCVIYCDLDKDSLKKEIKNFIRHGTAWNIPLLWQIGPSSGPKDIESFLSKEGFKYDDHVTGMAADITGLNNDFKTIPGFKITAVENSRQLSIWAKACLMGFDENGKNFQSIYEFEEPLGYDRALPWVRFIGTVRGEAIATIAVFMGSETAGLDNVTTVPQWRGRGAGALMVSHALKFAQSLNYRVGVLQASDMGINLYDRLGFRKFYTSKEYIWKKTGTDEQNDQNIQKENTNKLAKEI